MAAPVRKQEGADLGRRRQLGVEPERGLVIGEGQRHRRGLNRERRGRREIEGQRFDASRPGQRPHHGAEHRL